MSVQEPSGFSSNRATDRRTACVGLFVLMAVGLLTSCASQSTVESSPQDPTKVVIGTAGPMSGPYAVFGEQMARGGELAVSDLNAAGGVLGKEVVLMVGDDRCDRHRAVSVANRMADDGAVFMAGHFCSASSIPASRVYTEEGILQISPASTNPALTDDGGRGVFRVCGRDDWQAAIAARYIMDKHPGANIAITHDQTGYGQSLADTARQTLNEAGVTETLNAVFFAGRNDYSGLVSKLESAGIDVLYVGGYHTEVGLIARQMAKQGLDIQIVGADALVTDEYWSISGDAGEGTLMTFGPEPRRFPEAQQVVTESRSQGHEPDGYTLYTYAAIQVWAQAAESAGSFDMDAIVGAMRSNRFQTVLGELTFDGNGDIEQSAYVMWQWSRNTYRQITPLAP